jgi:hypothetical protein
VEMTGNDNCPYRYSPVPSYQPQAVPQVTQCLTEVVRRGTYRLAYSSTILKIITVFLSLNFFGLLLAPLALKTRPILVLGDLISKYFQNPDPVTAGQSLLTSGSKFTTQLEYRPLRVGCGYLKNTLRGRLKDFKLLENDADRGWILFNMATTYTFFAIVRTMPGNNTAITLAASKGIE